MKKACPKCGEVVRLTKHHLYPVRHFGKGKQNNTTILICRPCHDELETRIPFVQMSRRFYLQVVDSFLKEKDNVT